MPLPPLTTPNTTPTVTPLTGAEDNNNNTVSPATANNTTPAALMVLLPMDLLMETLKDTAVLPASAHLAWPTLLSKVPPLIVRVPVYYNKEELL